MEPKLFNTTAITPSHFVCGGAKKWLGVALGVVASIAAPFLAPMLATTLFGAGFGASILGNAAAGALIGGVGGAAGAALSGGDIMKGALFGAAGGGLAAGGGAFLGGAGLTGGTAVGQASNVAMGAQVGGLSAGPAGGVAAGVGGAPSSALLAATQGTTSSVLTQGGQPSTFAKITESLLSAGPQAIAKMMTMDEQNAYLDQLEAQMKLSNGVEMDAYNRQLKLHQEFEAAARDINPAFERRLASAQVKRTAAAASYQRKKNASLRDGIGEAGAESTERIAGIETALASHTAGLNAGRSARDARMGALQTAYNTIPQLSNRGTQNAATLARIEDQKRREREELYANTFARAAAPFRTDQPASSKPAAGLYRVA